MKVWTFQEAVKKVQSDCDLQDESAQNFITNDEMIGYFNDAIHEAESVILDLYEDYFLTQAPLTLVQAQALYDLPADIYGQKLRALVYSNGTVQYTIRRLRREHRFYDKTMIETYGQQDDYHYILQNPGGAGASGQCKICLVPPSRHAGALVTLWYIRSANRIPTMADEELTNPNATFTTDQLTTLIDIPEFTSFVVEWVKWKCLSKDSDMRAPAQQQVAEGQRKKMIESLTDRVPDEDNCIPQDFSFYNEMS